MMQMTVPQPVLPLANGADEVRMPGWCATKVNVPPSGTEVVTTFGGDFVTAYDKGNYIEFYFYYGRGQLSSAIRRAAALKLALGPFATLRPWKEGRRVYEILVRVEKRDKDAYEYGY